ncbi:MAG: choice-of-anchor V domain-containing protein [Promethearchaeota archaeon]
MFQISKSKSILCLTVFASIPVVLIFVLFTSSPSSPGDGYGGGITAGCNCHTGAGAQAATITIVLEGFPEDVNGTLLYNGTESYNLMVTVTDSSFSSTTGGVWIHVDKGNLSPITTNLRQEDSDLVQVDNSATSWNFTWTAPPEDSGWVTFDVYGMVSNGAGGDGDYWNSAYFQIAEYGGVVEPPPPPPVEKEIAWWRYDQRIEDWMDYISDELEISEIIFLSLSIPLLAVAIYYRNWLLGFLTIIGAVAALCNAIPQFMSDFVFDVLPPITLLILIIGVPIRVSKWISGPKTLVIKPETPQKWIQIFFYAIENLILDLAFFRRIFRRDKVLWCMVWPMHICAVLLIFSGIHHMVHGWAFGISDQPTVPVKQLINIGIHVPGMEYSKAVTLIISFIFVGELIFLTLRRKFTGKVSLITKPDVYLDLLVLIFLGMLGIYMFFASAQYNGGLFDFDFFGIFDFQFQFVNYNDCIFDIDLFGISDIHLEYTGILTLHAFFALLYFLSIPFTFYTHIFGGAIIAAVSDGLRRAQLGIKA